MQYFNIYHTSVASVLDFGILAGRLGCDKQVLPHFLELGGYGVGVFVQDRDYEERYDT